MKRSLGIGPSIALIGLALALTAGVVFVLRAVFAPSDPMSTDGGSVDRAGTQTSSHQFEKPLRRVVFIGVDAADWDVIDPLIAEGRLPNFKRFVDDGATGRLRSIEPLLSPLIWTTIATGKLPEAHGILNFTVVDPKTDKVVPISRLYRRVDAVWNMLSDYNRSVDIVGWLATFPAEKINGTMVTNRVGYLSYPDADLSESALKGLVTPRSQSSNVVGGIVSAKSVAFDAFKRFVAIDEPTFNKNRGLGFDPENPINNMILLYAATLSYHEIAKQLLASGAPDFLAVYFDLVDATKHLFMHYAPPRLEHIAVADYNTFKNAVEEAYVLQDRILGEMMALCDDNTVLIIASDHGFKSGALRPRMSPEIREGNAAFWHEVDGIVGFYGKGVRRGATIEGASILDLAPTFLALQGLPQPNDMTGKPLDDAFDDDLAAQFNRTTVATLQRERQLDDLVEGATGATAEEMKKLLALGYITLDNPDAHNNLGQRLQRQGEFEKAIAEFKEALVINPDFAPALNNLGVCYGRLGRFGEAKHAFDRALQANPKDVQAMNNLAILFMQQNKLEQAVKYGEMAITVEPNYANGHQTLGSIYATMGRLEDAEREFRKTIDINPADGKARANLERVRAARASKSPH